MDREMDREMEIKVLEEQIELAKEQIRILKQQGSYYGQWIQLAKSSYTYKWRLGFKIPKELRNRGSAQKSINLYSMDDKDKVLEIIPEIISDLQKILAMNGMVKE